MNIVKFEKLVLEDPYCKDYTLVRLTGEYDKNSGMLITYRSYSPTEWIASITSLEIIALRDRVVEFLLNRPLVVIIDDNNKVIFTSILGDPYFLLYAKNTEYRFQPIDANLKIAKIVEEAFPIPEESSPLRQKNNCILM